MESNLGDKDGSVEDLPSVPTRSTFLKILLYRIFKLVFYDKHHRAFSSAPILDGKWEKSIVHEQNLA